MSMMDVLHKMRHAFREENIEPPKLVVLASHEDGVRFMSELEGSMMMTNEQPRYPAVDVIARLPSLENWTGVRRTRLPYELAQHLAIESKGRADTLREAVKAFFAGGGTGTADEVAGVLGEPILAIRPRCSELRKLGLITETGERRKSDGGRPSHVWRWVR